MVLYQSAATGNVGQFKFSVKYAEVGTAEAHNRLNYNFGRKPCLCCFKARALKSRSLETGRASLEMKQSEQYQGGQLAEMNWLNVVGNMSSSSAEEDLGDGQNYTPAISQVVLAPTAASSLPVLPVGETVPMGLEGVTGVGGNGSEAAEDLNSFYFYEAKVEILKHQGGRWVNTGFNLYRPNVCKTFFSEKEIWYEIFKDFDISAKNCPPVKGTEQFAVLWILFTVIVLGNSSVLVAMFMNKNRKSRMNFFIKQLALADLSVGLLNVLTDIVWRITISWRAGNIACKVIRFSQVCVTYASTYVLVALSIDRYDAITHPMNFSKSWKRARRLVASAWFVSGLFSAPMLVLYEEKLIQGQTQCWIELGEPWRWQVYMSLVSATLFAFPALIITACYAVIVRTIWVKGSGFIQADRAACANATTRRASSRGIIPRAKVKTIKMTFVIVIVFIVCWSPYIVFDLLQVFGHIPRTQTNIAIATFIQSLAPLNSAANPLIYCMFSTQIFRSLSRIPPFKWFQCCWKSNRSNSAQNRCNTVGQRLHNSCDSMRTLTTSLTVSRRSNKTARVVIVERPKTAQILSEV